MKLASLNLLYIATAYLGFNYETASVLGILILLDILTGIIKTYKVHGGSSIRSRILAVGIMSKFLLMLIPITVALAVKSIGTDATGLVNMTFAVLSLGEAYSIIANIYVFRTGEKVPEFDVLHLILKKIRSTVNKNYGDKQNEDTTLQPPAEK